MRKAVNKIEKLWEAMVNDLDQKDPHGDWPAKKIVMTQPFQLRVVSLHEGFEKHESFCNFVRQEAIRKEDFDESSLPPDLLEYVKEYDSEYDNNYPNIIEAIAYGDTLEEAIEDMRKKLCLLDYGYILMDDYFSSVMKELIPAWREVVSYAVRAGIPMPAFASALTWFDGYTTERLPANLLQAQRDYFGAHTYERVDRERGQFFHTNWTGHGGNTSAGTYNA